MAQQLEGNPTLEYEKYIDTFNFDEWIIKNKLFDIKQCLIDYNMNTLNNLDMNDNFSKLIYDKRMVTKYNLFQRLVSSMVSLKNIRHKKEKEKKIQLQSTKLIFMTEKENNVFIKIQQFMDDLDEYKNELEILNVNYKNKQKINNIKINNYSIKATKELNDISRKINDI